MSKPIGAGSEVDAYCTKCKMELGHRVIAVAGGLIKRVECLTCRGHHNYRSAAKAAPKKVSATPKKRATKTASVRKAEAAVADHRQAWAQAIQASSAEDFTPYTLAGVYETGQLLQHKKFGKGLVLQLIEGDKVQVMFDEGPKTLAFGR